MYVRDRKVSKWSYRRYIVIVTTISNFEVYRSAIISKCYTHVHVFYVYILTVRELRLYPVSSPPKYLPRSSERRQKESLPGACGSAFGLQVNADALNNGAEQVLWVP
jgi:hypothetical protein